MRKEYSVAKSEALFQRAKKTIPLGTLTDDKKPIELYKGYMPFFIEKGQGCYILDIDGNKFIDYRLGFGKIILGYNYPIVDHAVSEQLKKGVIFSMANSLEVKLAERLLSFIPCAEMVHFSKTKSDAMQTGIRIARSYTRKEKIVSCGYNSWHDWWLAKNKIGIEKGVPNKLKNLVIDLKYNDIKALQKIIKKDAKNIAAIITVPYDLGDDTNQGFLEEIRWLTSRNKIILIFDEVFTGFRLAPGGGQQYFKITPDMAVFSNALSNGFPLSVLVGREKFLKKMDDLFINSTYAGETLSLMAALATLEEIKKNNVVKHIWKMGEHLMEGFNAIAQEVGIKAKTYGLAPCCRIEFEEKDPKVNKSLKRVFNCEMFRNGIFVNDNMFITYSHKEKEIDYTLKAAEESLIVTKRRVLKM